MLLNNYFFDQVFIKIDFKETRMIARSISSLKLNGSVFQRRTLLIRNALHKATIVRRSFLLIFFVFVFEYLKNEDLKQCIKDFDRFENALHGFFKT